jgi:hypothetical protein
MRSRGRSRLSVHTSTDLWETLVAAAAAESPLWAEAVRRAEEQERDPVFSVLGIERYALAIETIYEGYLVHYGRPRLFAAGDRDVSLLLGDYLYAHGLVRVAATGDVAAVDDLAQLISLCAQCRADGRPGDGAAWAASAAALGEGRLDAPRAALRDDGDWSELEAVAVAAAGPDAVARALAAHGRRLG